MPSAVDTRKRVFQFLGAQESGPPNLTRYDIGKSLGEGAMALVYRAMDKRLGRPVAIKVLKDKLGGDVLASERFVREAQAMARLSHPNIVTLHDAGIEEGKRYMVMEFVEGPSLRDILGKAELRETARILEKVARGVDAANSQGVIHRDLKPENILVGEDGEPKVSDFGVAHLMESGIGITKNGAVMGTPLYMAPEQVTGDVRSITRRTDVYALGVMLYEILTGSPPFDGRTSTEVFQRTLDETPPRPGRVPEDLRTICMKALEKDPLNRYGSAGEFAEEIQRWHRGEPILARPTSWFQRAQRFVSRRRNVVIPIAAALMVALLAAGWVFQGRLENRARFHEAMANARQLEKQHYYEEARDALMRARELDPVNAQSALERIEAIIDARKRVRQAELDRILAERRADKLLEEAATFVDEAEKYRFSRDIVASEVDNRIDTALDIIREAHREAPDYPPAFLLEGRACEVKGDHTLAERSLRVAVDLDDEFGPAHLRLGRILMVRSYLVSLGGTIQDNGVRRKEVIRLAEEAQAAVDEALALKVPAQMQKELMRAFLAYATRRIPNLRRICVRAIQDYKGQPGVEDFYWLIGTALMGDARLDAFQTAVNKRPDHYLAIYGQACDLWNTGRRSEALERFDRVVALCPRVGLIRLQRGMAYLQHQDHRRALEDLNEAVKLIPDHPESWGSRGSVLALLGEVDAAIRDLNHSIKMDPQNPTLFLSRSIVWRIRGNYARSIQDCNEALKLKPGFADAFVRRGQARYANGNRFAAFQEYSRALNLDNGNFNAFKALAAFFMDDHRHDDAFKVYNTALAWHPSNPELHELMGKAHHHVRDYEEAVLSFTAALEHQARNPEVRRARALSYRRLTRFKEALADIREALRLLPDDVRILQAEGLIHLDMNGPAKAIRSFNRALAGQPRYFPAIVYRGFAYGRLSEWPKAMADFDQALTLRPGNFEALWLRARVHEMRGNDVEAIRDLEIALRTAPKNWYHRRDVYEMLKRLKAGIRWTPSRELQLQRLSIAGR